MIPEDVRRFAEDPAAYGSDPAPESGLRRILTPRFCLVLGPVPSFTLVSRLRLLPEEVPETIAEVRAHVAEHAHRDASWWVGSSATPGDVVDRLRAHGLVPDERPGWEPHATAMVLTREPPPGPEGVVARRVASLEEYMLTTRIAHAAFGSSDDEAEEWDAVAEERYTAERAGHAPRTYLAFADGEPVAAARAVVEAGLPALLMIGGGVLPAWRGRGAYRSLVRARWDDAVAAGTPALTTHAGAHSRPILERLGFEPVAEIEGLLDPATA